MQLCLRLFRAGNSVDGGRVWLRIRLFQAFMGVLVTCKNEEDPLKNEGARVYFLDAQGQLTPK